MKITELELIRIGINRVETDRIGFSSGWNPLGGILFFFSSGNPVSGNCAQVGNVSIPCKTCTEKYFGRIVVYAWV